MSTPQTALKDEFLSQIWSLCTTFTQEAMNAASVKCNELGLDPNRGVVSLSESFINLASGRAMLEDAIEKQKLVQLPITVQKELLANLQNVSKSLQGLTNGVDEVVNLTNAIEVLNTSIWKYGLHNLSDEVLGYQKKLNQLKIQEVQLSEALRKVETAKQATEQATIAASEVEQKKTEVISLLEQVKSDAAATAKVFEQVKDADIKTAALFLTVQQHEKQSGELTANIKTASNELSSLDASIRKFYGEVDEYRKRINETSEQASSFLATSESAFKKLTDDMNSSLQKTIETFQGTATATTRELTARVDGKLSEAEEALGTLRTASESAFKKFTDDANSSVQKIVESLQAAATATTTQLTAKVDAKLSEAGEALAKLTTDTKADVTGFRAEVESKLQSSVQNAGATTSKLVTDATQKIDALDNQLTERSKETIEANHSKTQLLLEELGSLKEQIRAQLQQATGFTLFGAFQARQNQIVRSKNFWKYAIFVLVLISVGVTAWIAHEAQFYTANNFAFWVKLSLTVPLGFAITFCTVQYSRERRLEEEYAFKSSISVSLNPYRDLVHSILERDETVDKNKYTDFVIDSVKNVFTPPTDKVFDGDKKPSEVPLKALKQVAEIAGTVAKAGK
jgi:uncharacterized protein YjbJ (UPF0337 family)/uncharacterized coiled-coil DUF342 family protein